MEGSTTRPDGSDLPVFEVSPADAVGLLLPDTVNDLNTTVRHDPHADQGPWTVTVRRPDGSFGRHGAVVTFPLDEPVAGSAVHVGDTRGRLDGRTLTWPVEGGYAQVRGDLGPRALVTIAEATTTRGGRPVVRPPDGFDVVASGPYRAPDITEARYGFHDDEVSGLVSMGLIRDAGGFEDAVYAGPTTYRTTVRGLPGVASPVYGGNFVIAWEVRPGVVAYVGDSGMTLSPPAVSALGRLAERAEYVDAGRWRATQPMTVDGVNDFRPTA